MTTARAIGFVHVAAFGDDLGWLCDGYALQLAGEERATIHRTAQELVKHIVDKGRAIRLYGHSDRSVIQMLADGETDIVFASVRRSEIVCAYLGGGLIEWVNCAPLIGGASLDELRRAGPNYRAARDPDEIATEALAGLIAVAGSIGQVTGTNPLFAQQRTAAGVANAWLIDVIGERPVDLECEGAHRGGRAEVYRLGQCGDAIAIDANSSYPFAFLDTPGETDELLLVTLDVPEDQLIAPAFDVLRTKRLVFPTGTVTTWIAASHLERYVPARVRRIIARHTVDLRWLREAAPLMQALYDQRVTAKDRKDLATAIACKALLNGAYGKIAINGAIELAVWRRREPRNGVFYKLKQQQKLLVFAEAQKVSKRVNFPMAAWISDNARARLFDVMSRTSGLYYAATDSIKSATVPMVEIGKGLGQWKIEKTGELMIRGLHSYTHGDERKRSGGDEQAPRTLRAWARQPDGVERIERHETGKYEGRHVNPDGTTRPIVNR